MFALFAPIAALLVSVGLVLMGNGLQSVLLPIFANLNSFSTLEIGVMGAAYFIGFAGGSVLGPHLVERAGHIRAFAALVSIASAVAVMYAMVVNPTAWWILRCATGFCFAGIYMIIESWLNERATNATRGAIFAGYTVVNLSVVTVGQLMIVLYDPAQFFLFALSSVLISLAVVPVALTRSTPPAPILGVQIRLRRLFEVSPVGVVGCCVAGFANGSFWSLAPVYAQVGGLAVSQIALFVAATTFAGAAGQWPLGRLSDKIDRRLVVVGTAVGAAASGLGLAAFGHGPLPLALALVVVYGFVTFPVYTVSVAHANDFAESDDYAATAGGLLLVYSAGAIVGPLAAAALMQQTGPAGLFLTTAAAHATLAAFAVARMRRRPRPPAADRVPFAEALVAAQTVSQLDPAPAHADPEPSPDKPASHPR